MTGCTSATGSAVVRFVGSFSPKTSKELMATFSLARIVSVSSPGTVSLVTMEPSSEPACQALTPRLSGSTPKSLSAAVNGGIDRLPASEPAPVSVLTSP